VATLACAAASAPAQDANKILDEFIKASGGSRALHKLLTVSFGGTVAHQGDEKSGTYTLYLNPPIATIRKSPSTSNPKSLRTTANLLWRETSVGELGTLTGPEAVELEAAASCPIPISSTATKQKRPRSSPVRAV